MFFFFLSSDVILKLQNVVKQHLMFKQMKVLRYHLKVLKIFVMGHMISLVLMDSLNQVILAFPHFCPLLK